MKKLLMIMLLLGILMFPCNIVSGKDVTTGATGRARVSGIFDVIDRLASRMRLLTEELSIAVTAAPQDTPRASAIDVNEPSCDDFKIMSFKGIWKRGWVRAIGEIKNERCAAVGVQIKIIVRNKFGAIVASRKVWPSSTCNIYPGKTRKFTYVVTKDKSAKTIEVKVVRVIVW